MYRKYIEKFMFNNDIQQIYVALKLKYLEE
jgi:hypothetical protein